MMSAIYGPDGHDRTVQDAAFNWDAEFDWKKLRVGYLKSEFDSPEMPKDATEEQKRGPRSAGIRCAVWAGGSGGPARRWG